MEDKKEISQELVSLSKVVGDISRQMPYQVPGGYFDTFSAGVIDLIKGEESAQSSPVLAQTGKANPYAVPTGYFDNFASQLLSRIHAENSDTSAGMPPILAHEFDHALDSREELSQLSPLLSGLTRKSPFQAPEGYFSDLTANVVSGVQAIEFVNDELENLSPLMASLRKEPTFRAPDGYFEELAGAVLKKVTAPAETETPVISLGRRRRNWWQYSAAAATIGLILVGGYLNFHKTPPATSPFDITKSLSGVSDQDLENYLDIHNVPLAETGTNTTASIDFSENDIKSMLGDVSDAELKQYEDDQSGTKEPATN